MFDWKGQHINKCRVCVCRRVSRHPGLGFRTGHDALSAEDRLLRLQARELGPLCCRQPAPGNNTIG